MIALVDDDPSILRALRRLLGTAGFSVTTFGSGEELLAWDGVAAVDCVILDIHLAGVSGFEVQDRLRQAHPALPIIFITAHDDEATRERALRNDKTRYLLKPFDEQALIAAIRAALDGA